MTKLQNALIERFGEHRVKEIPALNDNFPLLALDLELKTPVTVIMTNGLSDHKMNVPEKYMGYEYNEIYFCLPSYWDWHDLENENMNWIFPWIDKLAKYVIEKDTWYGNGHTLASGKDKLPFSTNMKQNHLFFSEPILLEAELEYVKIEDKIVRFLAIIPVFLNEKNYKESKGTFKFRQKLNNQGVTEKLDDFRASVMKSKWRLRSK